MKGTNYKYDLTPFLEASISGWHKFCQEQENKAGPFKYPIGPPLTCSTDQSRPAMHKDIKY